jgi:hypothetical protein
MMKNQKSSTVLTVSPLLEKNKHKSKILNFYKIILNFNTTHKGRGNLSKRLRVFG